VLKANVFLYFGPNHDLGKAKDVLFQRSVPIPMVVTTSKKKLLSPFCQILIKGLMSNEELLGKCTNTGP
jgi:hypothetical protein